MEVNRRPTSRERLVSLWPWIAAGSATGLGVALLDPAGALLSGWWGYVVLGALGGLALWGAHRWIGGSKLVIGALATAVLLRLLVGLVLRWGLPSWGYQNSERHRAGYFYLDAYRRDLDAWNLANSTDPLATAFTEKVENDQYGGLLLVSGLVYRSLGPDMHRPMLLIGLTALAGGLAALFTWGFTSLTFGGRAAIFAGWGVALYPEAVLLGASQMREPFLIAILAAVLYGYARHRVGMSGSGAATILVALLLCLVISPPYALLMMVVVLVALAWEGQFGRKLGWAGAGALLVLGVAALALTVAAWQQATEVSRSNPIALVTAWITDGAQFELFKLERGSGWVQLLFGQTPDWAHVPMATGNGLVQPFLPAALMDSTSLPFPRAIGILRALGWFVLLPFLIYAPIAAVRATGWRSLQTYLSLVVWLVIIGASYRLAGDQWDNPRARAVFLSAQMALAGWAWYYAKDIKSPWLQRVGIVVAASTLLFLQWYAGRYYETPRLSLQQTVLVLVIFAVFFMGGAIALDARRARRSARLTAEAPEV